MTQVNLKLLQQLKSSENRYKSLYLNHEYDHSDSIFEHIIEVCDSLIRQIDAGVSPQLLHELLRMYYLKMGWDMFLKNMEYVRPNHPDNIKHDKINKFYYDQMAKAVGLNDFQAYLKKPNKIDDGILKKALTDGLYKLDDLEEFLGPENTQRVRQAFRNCFEDIFALSASMRKKRAILKRFGQLLDNIAELGVNDTEDREVVAETIENCLLILGISDSEDMLNKFV